MTRQLDVIFDARCIQDSNHRTGGIGSNAVALLSCAREMIGTEYDVRLLSVTDPLLPPLPQEIDSLFDDRRQNSYTGTLVRPSWFVAPSPMTHDPLFVARLLDHPQILTVAVLYDFLPGAESDQYESEPAARVDYALSKYWLSRFDLLLSISRTSVDELEARRLIHNARATVTGPSIDLDPRDPQPGAQQVLDHEIGRLAWRAMMTKAQDALRAPPAAIVHRRRRAKMAVMTPLRPDPTGVAHFTAPFLAELGKHVDLHVFTETRRAAPVPAAASVRPLVTLPGVSARFDRVLGVMGNSHFHGGIFKALTRYGGACVAHDARLLGFYLGAFGEERTRRVAEGELARSLRPGEMEGWLEDESKLDAFFLGELAGACEPMFFHSGETTRVMSQRYGRPAVHLPFAVYREWPEYLLGVRARENARAALGIEPGEIAIVTFGIVHRTKAPMTIISAVALLRSRNIPANLYFVGTVNDDPDPLTKFCREIGAESYVRFIDQFVSEECYRNYLLAADLGVQLRTHGLGGLSGALQDSIGAGLPTVANDNLCEAAEAPDYIVRVPDNPSPVLIANAITEMIEANKHVHRPHAERKHYLMEHNFQVYTRRMLEALDIEGGTHT